MDEELRGDIAYYTYTTDENPTSYHSKIGMAGLNVNVIPVLSATQRSILLNQYISK